MRISGSIPLVLLAALPAPAAIQSDCIGQQTLVTASDPGALDDYGEAATLDGDTLVVGAPDGGDAPGAGAVYVYRRDGTGWTEEARLTETDSVALGAAVALDGDTLVAGAPESELFENGAVYVYTRSGTTWTQEARIVPTDLTNADAFGFSVDVEGDTLAFGAPGNPGAFLSFGAVYVYTRSGTSWSFEDKLLHPNPFNGDELGRCVSLEGDTIVTGAQLAVHPTTFDCVGSAYVYVRQGTQWPMQARILASDPDDGGFFGASCDLSAERIVVGAPNDDEPAGTDAGAAYVFERTGTVWSETAKLAASDLEAFDNLGASVSISGSTLLVGSPGDDDLGLGSGSFRAFYRSGTSWSQAAKVTAFDGSAGDAFGAGLDLQGAEAVVGARFAQALEGAAYTVRIGNPELLFYCTSKTTSQGCVPFMTSAGCPSTTSTNPFNIRGQEHVPGEAGLLIYGFKKFSINYFGGKLCVKNHIRTVAKVAKSVTPSVCGAATVGRLNRNFNQVIQGGSNPLLTSGQKVFAQWIQRDPSNTLNGARNLSNGIRFTITP